MKLWNLFFCDLGACIPFWKLFSVMWEWSRIKFCRICSWCKKAHTVTHTNSSKTYHLQISSQWMFLQESTVAWLIFHFFYKNVSIPCTTNFNFFKKAGNIVMFSIFSFHFFCMHTFFVMGRYTGLYTWKKELVMNYSLLLLEEYHGFPYLIINSHIHIPTIVGNPL